MMYEGLWPGPGPESQAVTLLQGVSVVICTTCHTLWLPLDLGLALGQSLPTLTYEGAHGLDSRSCKNLCNLTVWLSSRFPSAPPPSLEVHCSLHLVQPESLSGEPPASHSSWKLLYISLSHTFPSLSSMSFPLPPILLSRFVYKSPVKHISFAAPNSPFRCFKGCPPFHSPPHKVKFRKEGGE